MDTSEEEDEVMAMSAQQGWITDNPPTQREWHTPGWLSEKGTGRSHFHMTGSGDEESSSDSGSSQDPQ